MELIDQHTKQIMEGCKARARDAGLSFHDETLEYIVTNRDLLELSPKLMIPTLYDYWVHDVEVLKERGKYELYPHNPYETVINTQPAISFYNDNNPDWLNVMIFYHVLGHVDFFQNNQFFRHTWDYDFTGQALSDKRLIANLRSEKGRWVDYTIEFARGIDNLVGYFEELSNTDRGNNKRPLSRLDYYFDVFLQAVLKVNVTEYVREIERYNDSSSDTDTEDDSSFFSDIIQKHPEFTEMYKKYRRQTHSPPSDVMQFILKNSAFLNHKKNRWMKSVVEIVRKTSLFFQPQIRTKILNEGWASYWHETLFLRDDRISGHEVEFARVNAGVTAMPKVGLNPYALGMRLFYFIEEAANQGKYSFEFQRIRDAHQRRKYDTQAGTGRDTIFEIRRNLSDYLYINTFVNQDFMDLHDLFVVGKRLNSQKMVWEYYIQSRKAADYRQMIQDSLYHPPRITVDPKQSTDTTLYLIHHFEGKPLVKEYIPGTMLGIEYLWGGKVCLETNEVAAKPPPTNVGYAMQAAKASSDPAPKREIKWERVRYTMENRKLSRVKLS